MRVKNERVKELMQSNTVTISSVADIRDLCHDILEARELIDKQEALIKEMIEYIHDAVDYTDSCYCPTCVRTRTILEKTKEYSE